MASPWSYLDPLTYVNDILGLGGGVAGDVNSWLSSVGGSIASGLEGGVVALLRDIFNVVVGPLEIVVGVVLIVFALVLAFKNDMLQAARIFGLAG